MKIFFVRHGESLSNAGGTKASDADHLNGLTKNGQTQIKNVAKNIGEKIDAVYASPYNRTVLSGEVFIKNRPEKLELKTDDRLCEINYGLYTDNRDCPEMEQIAKQQIAGDYEVRFSNIGENKREIITRFMSFLLWLIDEQRANDTVVVFSHGRAISILEYEFTRVTDSKSTHVHTDNGSINQIILRKNHKKVIKEYLANLNKIEIAKRLNIVDKAMSRSIEKQAVKLYKNQLVFVAQKELGDIDLSREVLTQFTIGLFESKIKLIKNNISRKSLTKNTVILLVVFQNASNFIKNFINHYRGIGVNKIVFIDNDSDDNSIDIIHNNSRDIDVDIWQVDDRFDAIKAMGWKQRMIVHYGLNRWYINIDIDELLVFGKYKNTNIAEMIKFAQSHDLVTIGSVMIDLYPNLPFDKLGRITSDQILNKYCYYDKTSYTKVKNQKYLYRIFGGPRQRLFGVSPSLQKFPLIFAQQGTLGINPHFWYPYYINLKSDFYSVLLHYKFLPGDLKKYKKYAKSGVHYNNSKEYRAYIQSINKNPKINFYDNNISVKLNGPLSIDKVTSNKATRGNKQQGRTL